MNMGRKVKFKHWLDYKAGRYEILSGIIIGDTNKFYKIKTSDGVEYRKTKSSIDYWFNKEDKKLKLKDSLHFIKWYKKLLYKGEDYGDNIVRYYGKDGGKDIGYFEKKTIFKKKRVYDHGLLLKLRKMDDIREIIIKNKIENKEIKEQYFSNDKINIEKLSEILV